MAERSPLEEAIVAELVRQAGSERYDNPFVDTETAMDGHVLIDGQVDLSALAKAVEKFARADDSEERVTYDGQWPARPITKRRVVWDSIDTPDAPMPVSGVETGDAWLRYRGEDD